MMGFTHPKEVTNVHGRSTTKPATSVRMAADDRPFWARLVRRFDGCLCLPVSSQLRCTSRSWPTASEAAEYFDEFIFSLMIFQALLVSGEGKGNSNITDYVDWPTT